MQIHTLDHTWPQYLNECVIQILRDNGVCTDELTEEVRLNLSLNGDASIVKSDELTMAQGYDVNVSKRWGALISCEPDLCDIVCIWWYNDSKVREFIFLSLYLSISVLHIRLNTCGRLTSREKSHQITPLTSHWEMCVFSNGIVPELRNQSNVKVFNTLTWLTYI